MGADNFADYSEGDTITEAFNTAVQNALWECGHGGYTGTIAEKDSFVLIDSKVRTLAEAYQLSDKLMDDCDPRVDDKWGPAGALRVKDDNHNGWLFFGWASS